MSAAWHKRFDDWRTSNPAQWAEPPVGGSWFDYLNIFGHEHTVAPWLILICHFAIGLGTIKLAISL